MTKLLVDREKAEQVLRLLPPYAMTSTEYIELLTYFRAALDAPEVEPTCEWTKDPDFEMGDTYHSACGELWSFIDGGPAENRVSYCHHCGGKVKLATKDTK